MAKAKEGNFYSKKPRYCVPCKQVWFADDGELFHSCQTVKKPNEKNMWELYDICDICLTPGNKTEVFITNRLYFPTGCSFETCDSVCRNSRIACENKYGVNDKDREVYEKLLKTRVIWYDDGSYEVSVIEDDEERRLLDEHFINTIGKTYSRIVRLYNMKDEEYKKVLKKRLEKERQRLMLDLDDDDDDDYFNKLINPDKDPKDDK